MDLVIVDVRGGTEWREQQSCGFGMQFLFRCHDTFTVQNAVLLFFSDGWLTASTHFQWAACSWRRRLISLPPENAGFTFGIRRRIQTFTLVFLSFVWAWSVCIYTIWQFKYANLNPYEARQREMFTVCKKIKSRKLMHWRTMKTSDPVQPISISHWITAVSASATSAFNNFNLCLSWFHWETLQFYLLILTVCTIWQLHLRPKAVRAHHRLLHTHTHFQKCTDDYVLCRRLSSKLKQFLA